MKGPVVNEVRQHRMEHTQQYHSDLSLICEDLRKLEAGLGDRLVRTGESITVAFEMYSSRSA